MSETLTDVSETDVLTLARSGSFRLLADSNTCATIETQRGRIRTGAGPSRSASGDSSEDRQLVEALELVEIESVADAHRLCAALWPAVPSIAAASVRQSQQAPAHQKR